MTEQKQFSDWLTQKDAVLSDMRQVNHAEPKELIDLVQKLKVLDLPYQSSTLNIINDLHTSSSTFYQSVT